MAHLGRPGPYVFRRDYNLNVSNNAQGFSRRLLAKFLNPPPGVINIIKTYTFDCGPETYPRDLQLDWTSDFTGFIPLIAKLRIFVQINTGKSYDRFLEVSIKNIGLVWAMHRRTSPIDVAPGWSPIEPWVTDFYDPGYFDIPPPLQDMQILPKLWTDGPPH